MFTGIIEASGTIEMIRQMDSAYRVHISCPTLRDSINVDDSIAVNGICLTVVELLPKGCAVDAVRETAERSTLKSWTKGTQINLERGLQLNGRLDGHLVQGHVDGQAVLSSTERRGASADMHFTCEETIIKMIVEKGSIAVDGVSLTITSVNRKGFSVAVIPYTFSHTNLNELKPGKRVNVETDIIGKYVLRHLTHNKELNKSTLMSWGYEL